MKRHGKPLRRVLTTLAGVLALAWAGAAEARVDAPSLAERLDRALFVPHVSRELTGATVVDLSTGRVVYRRNGGVPLRPASNEKLTVAVAALDELGPGFRIPTEVLGDGIQEGDLWRGDLVLKGYGDPTLDREDLDELARRLRTSGIRRVSGRVLGDESYFDRRRTAPGWKPGFYKEESPPLSALVVDRGKLAGRTVDAPALAAARAFHEALAAAGIRVAGAAAAGRAAPTATPLAGVLSQGIARVVRQMNRESDNFIAESLVKLLGAEELGRGTTSAGTSVIVRALAARGVPLAGVHIRDGSGLSRGDRLTARALTALLTSIWADPALRGPFVASLPVAGVSGTLEDRLERAPARGRVRAKTGTTNSASTLSGYVGRRFAFSILTNGSPVATAWARRGQDRFAQLLAAQ